MATMMNPAQVKVIIDKNKAKREAFEAARIKAVEAINKALDEEKRS